MDKLNEKELSDKKRGFFIIGDTDGKKTRAASIADASIFIIALLFARCHILFGAHPCALALLAVMPTGVWYALAGGVLGSLTLGKAGIIYAMISVIVVFLRVVIHGGERPKEGESARKMFSERLILRLCTAVIGGFIISVYEVLLSGFNLTSVLFGVSMILLTPIIGFALSGLFDSGISPESLIKDGGAVFIRAKSDERRYMNSVFFRISCVTLIFLTSLSLKSLELLGVSASYIFASFITLLISKRFGALYGALCGFFSALGISHIHAVAFALAGIGAGLLFKIGSMYALIGGFAALSLWASYTSGLVGFLTALPEYIIGATLAFPVFKKLPTEKTESEITSAPKSAKDMVGTMALAFQNKYSGSLDALELALSELSGVIGDFSHGGNKLRKEDYKDIITEEADRACKSCRQYIMCISTGSHPLIKNADALAEKLMAKETISAKDIHTDTQDCELTSELAAAINLRISRLNEERFKHNETSGIAEYYKIISKMINEARVRDEAECAVDTALSEKLSEVFCACGFDDGTIRAFGERKKHIICAGEDIDGYKITDPKLKAGLEAAANIKLGTPEYFRRDKTVLMECTAAPKIKCDFATAGIAGSHDEISGDCARSFVSRDDRFFSLISDGMGKGEIASETSSFVADFLSGMLTHGYSKDTVLHILNSIIRGRGDECSATVDLFEADLLSGEALFIKSGAASSYVKRESSLFRIRSRTAPIGLMRTVDAERIKVEVQSGDYIIMLSDGINQSPEEAPWLIELLSKPPKRNLQEYADLILRTAVQSSPPRDDMTVSVIKIGAV